MSRKHIIIGSVLLMLLAVYSVLFFQLGDAPLPVTTSGTTAIEPKPIKPSDKGITAPQKKPVRDILVAEKRVERNEKADEALIDDEKAEEEPVEKAPETDPKYIEEIKEKIYERNIESVDQIALLDELVQTGDKDTRQFWGDGWTSVDDWKKSSNGFKLEKKEDGTMIFNPDEATASKYTFFENPKAYTYDEVNKEFVNEVDYYGKTIYNVAKFINDDVLVMMTISGTKVDLNIYQKNANQQ